MASSATHTTSDEHETGIVAATLAARLTAGDVVWLRGPIGAGKTTFVRSACEALGVTEPVTSPTFTTAHAYTTSSGRRVSHLDLYRAERLSSSDLGDLDPYLDDDTIVFVEWPDAGTGVLPDATVTVTIEATGERERRITITPTMHV